MELNLRSIYCPAHFGNLYECASKTELYQYFSELASWGINGIGTWFDPANACDPFSNDPLYRWAREMPVIQWDRKRKLLQAAQDNHFKLTLSVTPNVVYIDQLKPDLAAEAASNEYIGPNLCPSKPEARAIILQNCENLFRYLAEGGISLDFVLAPLRDYGGCSCPKCTPWVKTFLDLWEEILPILNKYHPRCKVQFCTWWVTAEEIDIIRSYLEHRHPEWVDGMNLSLGYSTEIPEVVLPKGYQKSIFLHISYASTHLDKYGVKGGVVAPKRLEIIFRKLANSDIVGFQAYSEGIYDDLNKFLVAHLGRNPMDSVKTLVQIYCENYFGVRGKDTQKIVDVIYGLEDLKGESSQELVSILEDIGDRYKCLTNWRFELLIIRVKVAYLEWLIGDENRWNKEYTNLDYEDRKNYINRIDTLVEERRKILDYLERYVYRVGAQCHGLDIDTDYKSWQRWKSKGSSVREEKNREDEKQSFLP